MSRNGYDPLKMETYILKVHVNCQGCKQKVKKLLRKIEGVYSVNIDAEHQMVRVTGNVSPVILLKKLVKSGKHAELWNQTSDQNQNHEQAKIINDDGNMNHMQYLRNGLNASQNECMFPAFLGKEVEDEWSFQNYLNRNIGMKAMTDEIDQNLMATVEVESGYRRWDGEMFGKNGRREHNMTSMMSNADFRGNETDIQSNGFQDLYSEMPTYEYDQMSSIANVSNMQAGIHCHYPSIEMINI